MTVTLQPDMTSVSVTVSTTTDNVIECPEDFQASLTIPTSSLNVGVVLGSPATVTVTIVDADARKLCVFLQLLDRVMSQCDLI